MPSKIVKCEMGCQHKTIDLSLELRTRSDLEEVLKALQDEQATVVVLTDRNHTACLYVYLRFREQGGAR